MIQTVEFALATWRVAHMLVHEAGPNRTFEVLRRKSGIVYGEDGLPWSYPDWTPLYCVSCTSVYVAAVMVFLPRKIVQGLAASGAAVLLERWFMR